MVYSIFQRLGGRTGRGRRKRSLPWNRESKAGNGNKRNRNARNPVGGRHAAYSRHNEPVLRRMVTMVVGAVVEPVNVYFNSVVVVMVREEPGREAGGERWYSMRGKAAAGTGRWSGKAFSRRSQR